jgi:hypothetical protein
MADTVKATLTIHVEYDVSKALAEMRPSQMRALIEYNLTFLYKMALEYGHLTSESSLNVCSSEYTVQVGPLKRD